MKIKLLFFASFFFTFQVSKAQNVGVNDDASAPTEILHVKSNSTDAAHGILIENSNAGTSADVILQFKQNGTTHFTFGVDTDDSDKLKLGTTSLATNTRITVNSSGDVGVGTVDPGHKLHVLDNTANEGVFRVDNPNAAGFAGMYFHEGATRHGWVGHVNSTSTFGGPGLFQVGTAGMDLVFSVNSVSVYAERMRISTAGNVGVNTTPTTTEKFSITGVSGVTNNTLYSTNPSTTAEASSIYAENTGISGNTDAIYATNASSTALSTALYAKSSAVTGNETHTIHGDNDGTGGYAGFFEGEGAALYAQTNDAASYYDVVFNAGGIYNVSGTYDTSDRRFKKDIKPIDDNTLQKILKLKPSQYYMDSDKFPLFRAQTELKFGLIAQELEEIFPHLTNNTKFTPDPSFDPLKNKNKKGSAPLVKGYYAVNYTGLIPILIKGMQEQQQIISEMQQQIESLNKKMNNLK